jgi:hypothetical protein
MFMLMRKKDNKDTMLSLGRDTKPNWNLKFDLNLLLFFFVLNNFFLTTWLITTYNLIYGSTTKLWSNNEQDKLWILIMQLIGTSKF